MWTYLTVALVVVQLAASQHMHKYIRFPVQAGHKGECHDPLVDKYFKVGEEWGPKNAYCKLSRCVQEDGVLYIDRVSCDNVRSRVDLKQVNARHLYCRIAAGDRREGFPGCCQQLVCKEKTADGKTRRLEPHELPLLSTEVKEQIIYA